jgi:hypothetical protein
MVRRLGLLVIVVAVLAGARLLQKRAVDVDLRVEGAAAATRVQLVFTDARERVERELDLRFDAPGAPAVIQRTTRLRAGAYTVGARLEPAGRTLSRAITVHEAGVYTLDLRP